jgi:putative phosphoribosyl transferase
MSMKFKDRQEAGRLLGEALGVRRGDDPIVLGLPRGGVPVAYQVARALGAQLDVVVVRKLGVPFQPELAMGAIGEDGVRFLDREVIRAAGIAEAEVAAVERRERLELERRTQRFRGNRTRVALRDRAAVVIDDGIATGSTARAACRVARVLGARRVTLAVPVAPSAAIAELADAADELVCLESPRIFLSVGHWYRDFSQTSDDEVVDFLQRAETSAAEAVATPPARS